MEGIPNEGYRLSISYELLNTYEMLLLLSNNDGYLDADKKCLMINVS